MMRKRILVPIVIVVVIVLAIVFWRMSQNVDVGYVVNSDETRSNDQQIYVIILTKEETKGKTRQEILQLIEQKESEDGTLNAYYSIPWINQKLKSSYQSGDRIRIYWSGGVNLSDPPQIPGTSLILKSEYN